MDKERLKLASRLLGSSDFWDSTSSGSPADADREKEPAWRDAEAIVSGLTSALFTDADGFSVLKRYREKTRLLTAKVADLNRLHRESVERAGRLSELSRTWSLLSEEGLVESLPTPSADTEPSPPEQVSVVFARSLEFSLAHAVQVEGPLKVAKLASLWAFGKRRLAKQVAVEQGVDIVKVRFWAELTRNYLAAMEERDEADGDGPLCASAMSDIDDIDRRLGELRSEAEARLKLLSTELNYEGQRLRERLTGLVFKERISRQRMGDAAGTRWGEEALALRDTLWSPLVPLPQASGPDSDGGRSVGDGISLSSQLDLSLNETPLDYIAGRLAGGYLDRHDLYALSEREFMGYLRSAVKRLQPEILQDCLTTLPSPAPEHSDGRAQLDVARRTAREIVKLRSFVNMSVDRVAESVSSSLKELAERSSGQSSDIPKLNASVSSLRRDMMSLSSSIENRLSSAMELNTIKEFLDLIDDVSRIASHSNQVAAHGLTEALEIVLSKANGILTRHNVRRIDAVGEQFNPALHECVGTREIGGEHGTIAEEVSIGYTIDNKVLRPAKVIVHS